MPLLARVGLVTPEQRAWAWYDWANSAYFTTVITAVFPTFYATYAAADLEPAQATQRFALITTVSVAIVAVASPILGAIADYSGIKKRLLLGFMMIGVIVVRGDGRHRTRRLAARLDPVHHRQHRRVGDDGVLRLAAAARRAAARDGSGVVGGVRAGVSGRRRAAAGESGVDSPAADLRLCRRHERDEGGVCERGGVVAGLFAAAAAQGARAVAAARRRRAARAVDVAAAFGRLVRTFREIRRYKHAFLLFIAMLLYQDGIQTIIRMASVYGAEVGIDQTAQIAAFVMVQFLGIPFAFLFGALGTRIGTKRALFIALAVYTATSIMGFFMTTVTHFFILAGMVATVQGGSQALSRALFSRLIPSNKTSEFFGFYAVAERFATVLGPTVFTVSVAMTGSSRSAVLFIIVFFAAGALVLSRVDEAEGVRAASATSPVALTPKTQRRRPARRADVRRR